jgi:hypothetical protein
MIQILTMMVKEAFEIFFKILYVCLLDDDNDMSDDQNGGQSDDDADDDDKGINR